MSARIEALFEFIGIEWPSTEEAGLLKHVLLRPKDLVISSDGEEVEPYWSPIDDDRFMSWTSIEGDEVDPIDTRTCLWEFVGAAEATEDQILTFTQKWGLINFGYEADYGEMDKVGALSLGEWLEEAEATRLLLVILAASLAGELVPEGMLERFRYADDFEDLPIAEAFSEEGHVDFVEFELKRNRLRQERWRRVRAEGLGLEMQIALATRVLNGMSSPVPPELVWDTAGRRLESYAIGIKEIVWSHLTSLFCALQPDIYVCSICGSAFAFDDSSGQRRPRAGAARFCSDQCRREGKLRSNRESWHRNSSRWRTSNTGSKGESGG